MTTRLHSKATKKISFTLKDSKGKAIAKKKITFKVNGKTYTAKTNSKGVATVKIVIKKKGKYTATAKFAGDTTYKAISKKAYILMRKYGQFNEDLFLILIQVVGIINKFLIKKLIGNLFEFLWI